MFVDLTKADQGIVGNLLMDIARFHSTMPLAIAFTANHYEDGQEGCFNWFCGDRIEISLTILTRNSWEGLTPPGTKPQLFLSRLFGLEFNQSNIAQHMSSDFRLMWSSDCFSQGLIIYGTYQGRELACFLCTETYFGDDYDESILQGEIAAERMEEICGELADLIVFKEVPDDSRLFTGSFFPKESVGLNTLPTQLWDKPKRRGFMVHGYSEEAEQGLSEAKTITFPYGNGEIRVERGELWSQTTSEGLKDACPDCGEEDAIECLSDHEFTREGVGVLVTNALIAGVESFIGACAANGVDIESKHFRQAVIDALDAISNYST